jgi:Leucine-rich repeat (LRR) protein
MSFRTNNLVCIPDELGRIPHLKVLNLCDNKLRCLPFGLIKLKELTALWLADNQVRGETKLIHVLLEEITELCLACRQSDTGRSRTNTF